MLGPLTNKPRKVEGSLETTIGPTSRGQGQSQGQLRGQWKGRSLALLGGLLTTTSIPPLGWWPLALLGLGLLPVALESAARARSRLLIAGFFATALYVPSLWWLTQFSLPGGIAIALIEVLITALTITVLVPRTQQSCRWHSVVSCTVAVVSADALRSLWPFGGLPLGGIDLGQADGPFAALVTFGGRLLLIGIVTLLGGALVLLLRSSVRPVKRTESSTVTRPAKRTLRRPFGPLDGPFESAPTSVPKRRSTPFAVAAACLLITVCAHLFPDGTHADRTLRVAIIQGSGPLGVRAVDDTPDRAFNATMAASNLIQKPVDLILWPENIVDAATFSTSIKRQQIGALATAYGAPIVAGVVEDDLENPQRFRNFSIVVGPGGNIGDATTTRYDKVRRVPFGEVVYFRSILRRFTSDLQVRDARAGTKPGVISTPFGPMAIIISYEGFFDDRARSGVRAGGQALLLPTNAASFTSSHLPTQQVAAARLRARETGRWVAQAAPTGISMVMAPNGEIVIRSAIQQRTALQATIVLRHGLTPYARWNDLPTLVLFAALGVLGWTVAVRERSGKGDSRTKPSLRSD